MTVEHSGAVPEYSTGGGKNLPHATGSSWFVGSVSTGEYGAAAMDYVRSTTNITAKKAWFFFDSEIVTLITDLKGTTASASNEVVTTLNQIRQSGKVTIKTQDGSMRDLENGSFENPQWLHHDETAYIFLKGNIKLTASVEKRTAVIGGKYKSTKIFTHFVTFTSAK